MIDYREPTEDQIAKMKVVADHIMKSLEVLDDIKNHEKGIAYTKAQELIFWMNNSIMIHGSEKEESSSDCH